MATKKRLDYRNCPTAWFSMLESSLERSNFERAAEAVRELKRLGVSVKFKGLVGKKLTEAERGLSTTRRTILNGGGKC